MLFRTFETKKYGTILVTKDCDDNGPHLRVSAEYNGRDDAVIVVLAHTCDHVCVNDSFLNFTKKKAKLMIKNAIERSEIIEATRQRSEIIEATRQRYEYFKDRGDRNISSVFMKVTCDD